jgi:uncharacterized Fe-S radical SAM superfamily protein PflX
MLETHLPSSLSSLELAFQIVAIYAFDNVINRPIHSALKENWNFIIYHLNTNNKVHTCHCEDIFRFIASY